MTAILRHWSAGPVILLAYVVVVAVHVRGLRARAPARRGALREALAFHGGLASVLLALVSPLGYWSGHVLWARMTQDVTIAGVAAPLLVLGAPWTVLARGLSPSGRPRAAWPAGQPAPPRPSRPARGGPRLARLARGGPRLARGGPRLAADGLRWLARPVQATAAFNVAWAGWHLPAPYDLTRTSTVHYAEFFVVLGSAMLLWLQFMGSYPWSPSLSHLRRIPLIFISATVTWLLSLVIIFARAGLYPAYAAAGHGGLPVSADQQFAGSIMWVGIEPALIVITTVTAYRWLTEEEEDPTSGLARLLRRRTSGWDSPLSLGDNPRSTFRHNL